MFQNKYGDWLIRLITKIGFRLLTDNRFKIFSDYTTLRNILGCIERGQISLPDNICLKIYWQITKKWIDMFQLKLPLKRALLYGNYHWFCQPAIQYPVYWAVDWRHISGSWKFLYDPINKELNSNMSTRMHSFCKIFAILDNRRKSSVVQDSAVFIIITNICIIN